MSEMQRERKRRKWDVAAPVPLIPATGAASQAAPPNGAQPEQTPQPTGTKANAQDVNTPAPQPTSSAPTADVIARAKLGAMSVLEKINKDLRAKGSVPMKMFGLKADEDRIRRDVVINDAPGPIRYNLTRRVTQDDIARRTGTQIVVRGQYQPSGAPSNSDEAPLFLKVTPGAVSQEEDSIQQYAVDVAAGEVQHILNGGTIGTYRHPVPPPASITAASSAPGQQVRAQAHTPGGQQGVQGGYPRGPPHGSYPGPYSTPQSSTAGSQPSFSQASRPSYANVPPPDQMQQQQLHNQQVSGSLAPVPLYIGLTTPPEYDLAGKLRGPGDSFLAHIARKSGTQVVLRGSGSGMVETAEPLHIVVSGQNQPAVDEAARLARNLIETVRNDFQRSPFAAQSQSPALPYSQPWPEAHAHMAQQPRASLAQGYPPPGAYPPHSYPPAGNPYSAPQAPIQHNALYNMQSPAYHPPQTPYGYNPAGPTYQMPHRPAAPDYRQQIPYQQNHHHPQGVSKTQSHQALAGSQVGTQAYYGNPPSHLQAAQNSSQALQSDSGTQQGHSQQSEGPAHAADNPESAQAGTEEQQDGKKRRFKEFKETPPPVPSQPAPYAPAPMAAPSQKTPASPMGPPAPRKPMGPPPPRNPASMGPPPPRPSQFSSQGLGKANDSPVSGSLAGLVDYD